MALVRELVGRDLERGQSSEVGQVGSGDEEAPPRSVWSEEGLFYGSLCSLTSGALPTIAEEPADYVGE
jgi:hypothetical protein